MNLYDETCFECSKLITTKYSTSFSQGIKAFDKHLRFPIYAIYGFVRYADEIVDTFHDHDKVKLINDFKRQAFDAIRDGISLNPVLQSFQQVVNKYHIEEELICAFFNSMEMDIDKKTYDKEGLKDYIYGSAEVIGMMCLRVFCADDSTLYQQLLPLARSLGSAFQKINFLRDVKEDYKERGRTYFPGVDFSNFTEQVKKQIEQDIRHDFAEGYRGIKLLPQGARLGVYVAYIYYNKLLKKISNTPAGVILQKRIRIPGTQKKALYIKSLLKHRLRMVIDNVK